MFEIQYCSHGRLILILHHEFVAVKHDPVESVRRRALAAIQRLPPEMITKSVFQVIALKCRDKAVKVRMMALSILIELGSGHAFRILKAEELNKTLKYLLSIPEQMKQLILMIWK